MVVDFVISILECFSVTILLELLELLFPLHFECLFIRQGAGEGEVGVQIALSGSGYNRGCMYLVLFSIGTLSRTGVLLDVEIGEVLLVASDAFIVFGGEEVFNLLQGGTDDLGHSLAATIQQFLEVLSGPSNQLEGAVDEAVLCDLVELQLKVQDDEYSSFSEVVGSVDDGILNLSIILVSERKAMEDDVRCRQLLEIVDSGDLTQVQLWHILSEQVDFADAGVNEGFVVRILFLKKAITKH